jgi:hypothetical protein
MSLKSITLLFTLALGGLAKPIAPRLPSELPVTVIEGSLPADLPVTVIEGSSPPALSAQQNAQISRLTELELPQADQALLLFRTKLGEAATNVLIAADIARADVYWHERLKASKGGKFVGGVTRARGYAPHAIFNATSVGLWFYFGGEGWPNDFLRTSPEHYLSLSGPGVRTKGNAIESTENWGPGPITYFTGKPEVQPKFIPTLSEYPADSQSYLALALKDGTVFAHSLTAFRDLPEGNGVEIYQGIWIPDSVEKEVLEGMRKHITVEFTNWLRFAYKKSTAGLNLNSTTVHHHG